MKEKEALEQLYKSYGDLEKLGWKNIAYCPKDGTVFLAICPGSTGIFTCYYHGEWPDGNWIVGDGGDLYVATPILFKNIAHENRT